MCKSIQICEVTVSGKIRIINVAKFCNMVMSFSIRYCDIELEHYLQILVNKYGKFAQSMLLCNVYCAIICARSFLHCVLRRISCIAPFLSLRPKKRLGRVLHILRHVLCRVFDHSCACEVIVPVFCATASPCISSLRCVANSVLGLLFKCRPIYYHPVFPNIRLIYSNQETTN